MHSRRFSRCAVAWAIIVAVAPFAFSQQTRDDMVRSDRQALLNDESWYYDDLEAGWQAAQAARKPLMVVLRCIP